MTTGTTVKKDECDRNMTGLKKTLQWAVGILLSACIALCTASAGVMGYYNSEQQEKAKAQQEKINRIAVASIQSDERIKEDVKEVAALARQNSVDIASQNSKYNTHIIHLLSRLDSISQDVKEIKRKSE